MKTIIACVTSVLISHASVLAQPSPTANQVINLTSRFLVQNWIADDVVSQYKPPQVLPLASGSRVFGACEEQIYGSEVGGSSYCGASHTIYLVPEELSEFEDAFGASSIAYVVAHEFGHAFQAALEIPLEGAARELQADCFAGMLINNGSEELGVNRDDVIAMATAAYNIGSDTHGTGGQRVFALLTGMGIIDSSCEADTMNELAQGSYDNDSRMREITQERSSGKKINTTDSPHRKSAKELFGL